MRWVSTGWIVDPDLCQADMPVKVTGRASEGSAGQHMVRIPLTPPAGRADLMFPWPVVTEFLQRTDAVVSPGTEHVHVDLDAN